MHKIDDISAIQAQFNESVSSNFLFLDVTVSFLNFNRTLNKLILRNITQNNMYIYLL